MNNRFLIFPAVLVAASMLLASSAQVQAGVMTMSYTTNDIGGGLYQYDFVLKVTNQDGSYSVGDNFNWIIFGDFEVGPSPISDFALLADSFPNPNMNFTSSGGFHNGPTWLDTNDIAGGGWNPIGVNDFVTWSGTSANNVTSGLQWSNLVGDTRHEFENATFVPEPTSLAIFGMIGLVACGRRRRS